MYRTIQNNLIKIKANRINTQLSLLFGKFNNKHARLQVRQRNAGDFRFLEFDFDLAVSSTHVMDEAAGK